MLFRIRHKPCLEEVHIVAVMNPASSIFKTGNRDGKGFFDLIDFEVYIKH